MDGAVGVAPGQAENVFPVLAVGDVLDGEIEFVAGDEIDAGRVFQAAVGVDRHLGADQADLELRIGGFQRLDAFHVGGEGRDGGVDDDEIEILGLRHDLGEAGLVRRGVDQLGILDQSGGLGQPGRIPEGGDFTPRLIARAGAAVKSVKGRRLQKESAHSVPLRLSYRKFEKYCATKPRNRGHSVAP